MQFKIQNGVVELSGEAILNNINFEIKDNSKIAVVGRNGCGKTTLLRLVSGEYSIKKSDSDTSSFISRSGDTVIGVLNQMTFNDESKTLIEEIRNAYGDILNLKKKLDILLKDMEKNATDENIKNYTDALEHFTSLGGFYFEKEYEAAIKNFGFTHEQKQKPLAEFSGGQRTKIAFLKLILSKPDILLLDEPTNHLDIEAVSWLEGYLRDYKKAVVIVSHDRMFLDSIVDTVYEIEHGKTNRYSGSYTQFTEAKKALREQQAKEYIEQQKEIKRLTELVERFKAKPTKAAMARSKLKQLEHIIPKAPPESYDMKTFHANFSPEFESVNDVLSVSQLEIGYDEVLSVVDLDMKKGEKIGIIGGNGLGKSTFIKTIVNIIKPLGGSFEFGQRVKIGYFDQQMAGYKSKNTVLDDFLNEFPGMGNNEARSSLGAFLFSGEDVFKQVDMLSGGERVRLALCKIFKTKPNFLILDEPTNHMDIVGKETLEEILLNFHGSLIFVSHDRYFIKKIADSLLSFENGHVRHYEYGYDQYLEAINNAQLKLEDNSTEFSEDKAKPKKGYTTPAKEQAKKDRAIKKSEERIAELEEKLSELNALLQSEETLSDYIRLEELNAELVLIEEELSHELDRWEQLLI